MSYITAAEYETYVGEAAPDNFLALSDMAGALIDAHTLYGYSGRDFTSLPVPVSDALKRAMAYEIMHLSQIGGVQGANDGGASDVSLGQFRINSASGSGAGACDRIGPVTASLLPFLNGYARGLDNATDS